jgi:hypothetical protein
MDGGRGAIFLPRFVQLHHGEACDRQLPIKLTTAGGGGHNLALLRSWLHPNGSSSLPPLNLEWKLKAHQRSVAYTEAIRIDGKDEELHVPRQCLCRISKERVS